MSGLNDQDARALTYLALRIRAETHGAGPWDEHGTAAKVAQLKGRSLAMTAEDIIRHAADAKARTPGVLLGSFKPKPVEAPEPTKRGNPKRGEDCPRHVGQWPDACAGCATEDRAVEVDPVAPNLPPPSPRLAQRLAVRDALRAVRGNGNDEEGTQ